VAKATSISLSKLTAAVQAAVKAAVQKHPKFNMGPPTQLAISHLILGIPVDSRVAKVTLDETQAFAADIASHLSRSGEFGKALEAAVYSHGNHLIIGIPQDTNLLLEK